MGPLPGEGRYDWKKRMLLRFKELYGDMLVPAMFVVTYMDSWPEEMWGYRLGRLVNNIRSGLTLKSQKEDLISIGFEFETGPASVGRQRAKQ